MSNSQETTTIDKEKQTTNLTARNQKKPQVSKLPKPPFQSANSSNKPPQDKKFTLKKRSKTNISIQSHCGDPQKNRPLSQSSPKKLISHPSTATLGSHCHTLGTVPKYLKRNATAAIESELISKKKVTDAQVGVPKTMIPLQGESTLSNRSANGQPPQEFTLKTRSKTNISIQTHCGDPQKNRPLSQSSPKKLVSNPSTATLGSHCHTLGTVPKYLKRNATAAIESELISKKKVTDAQVGVPKTMIPLQGESTLSNRSANGQPPQEFTLKTRSKTNISIQTHCGDPQKNRPLSQSSPKKLVSNPSTATLGSHCHTLGTVPKYLKRNATAAIESELISKKKVTDAQVGVPKTMIPLQGESTLSNRSANGQPPQEFTLKTRSKTNISIQTHCGDPQKNRPLSQSSPKKLVSNPSTATLGSHCHTLGTVPKYLKRNATAAIESELISKKKVTDAQVGVPKTMIPLQGESTLSNRSANGQPPQEFTLKTRSKTNISIQTHCGDPQKNRPLSQSSPKKLVSNPSTATLGSHCHTLGTVPKYLKRNATAAIESELISKKKVTDAQVGVPKTMIPLQGESTLSNRSANGQPPQEFTLKTRSKTNISIQSHCGDPQKNRPLSQSSPKKLVSNPSTATLGSHCHTLGTVPKYLKRNATAAIQSELIAKQKLFLAQKKNITDAQDKLLAQYKELQDYHKKKSLKGIKVQDFGEFHLLAVVRDNAGELLIKDENLGKFPKKFSIPPPPTDKVIAALPLEDMSKRILSVHSAGFKLCQEFVDSFDNIRSSCETQEAGDASDLEKRVVAILKSMEAKILETEKDQKEFITDFIKEIQQSASSASEDNTAELKKQLQNYQCRLEKSENEFSEWKSKAQENESPEVAVELKNLENKLNSKLDELARKEEIIVKLQDEINQLKQTDNKMESDQKVLDASQLYETEKELRLKIQNEMTEKDALIKRIQSEIQNQDNLQNLLKDANEKLQELQQENYEIKKSLDSAETKNQELEDQLQQIPVQLNSLNETKITHLEALLSEKENEINHLQQKLENAKITLVASNENLDELNRLRELAMERTEEIESLRDKLARAENAVKQQEGNVFMLQRLLRIRCELINSLQEKEASNRCRLDDLYTEMNKKTRLVNQMNHEISAKAEELQNLFSTLSAKQIDISKQERTIKMLEHNNDRMQRLWGKQEERIAKLESENSELRHILNLCHESTINQDKTALQKLFVNWKQLFKTKGDDAVQLVQSRNN